MTQSPQNQFPEPRGNCLLLSPFLSLSMNLSLFSSPRHKTFSSPGGADSDRVTQDSVGLLWTVPQGTFNSFVVQYKDRAGQPQVVPEAADQREVTISGLEPNRKCKFLLYGLGGRKQLGPISTEGTMGEPQRCLPPFPKLSLF